MNRFSIFSLVVALTQQQASFSIDLYSFGFNVLMAAATVIFSGLSAAIVFTRKATLLEANFKLKLVEIKYELEQMKNEGLLLTKRVDSHSRNASTRLGNLDVKITAMELFLAKEFSFVPKETRNLNS